MENLSSASSLVWVWLLASLICPLCLACLLWRAARSGQFSSPERSAALPLEGYIPEEEGGGRERPSRVEAGSDG